MSITNVSPVDSQFVVQINYPGGPYLLDPQKLPAGATATFDLREIRDQQIPDRNGHTIPRTINGGQFRWFIHRGGRLIGRAEMLSVSRGISSSYSCFTPCPATFDRAWIEPEPTTVGEGDATPHETMEIDKDSYGNEYGPFAANVVNSWSWDAGIATFDFGTVTGVSAGATNTTATVEYPLYWWDNGTMDCMFFDNEQTNVNGTVAVSPTITVGNVTLDRTTIKPGTGAVLSIQLSASSGVISTSGTSLEVSITDSSGPDFTLEFSPATRQVNLSPGESRNFTFNVTVGSQAAPTSPATCQLGAHVTAASGIIVIDNDKKSPQLTVEPL